jgi:hypothetical protein
MPMTSLFRKAPANSQQTTRSNVRLHVDSNTSHEKRANPIYTHTNLVLALGHLAQPVRIEAQRGNIVQALLLNVTPVEVLAYT